MTRLPIPQSAGRSLVQFLNSGLGLLLWRILLLTAIVFIAAVLVSAGGVYGIVSGILIGVIAGGFFRRNVTDLWHFRFYNV